MRVLYIDDYQTDEQKTLEHAGVICSRAQQQDVGFTPQGLEPHILRGPKLSEKAYGSIFSTLARQGVCLTTSFNAHVFGQDLNEQHKILHDFFPPSVVLDSSVQTSEILDSLKTAGLEPPLFLRSERESAAKYVGVAGCTLQDASVSEIERVRANLQKHVAGSNTLVFKKLVPIAKDRQNGKDLEYRAMAVGGRLLAFDTIQQPPHEIQAFVEHILDALDSAQKGGDFFIDVAQTQSNTPVLIECKSLVNGSIRHPEVFARALKM